MGTDAATAQSPVIDPYTEALVMSLIEFIQEQKSKGYRELEATYEIISRWISGRSGIQVNPRQVAVLAATMAQAGIITIGGGGIGTANRYDTTESKMGVEQFWNQVEALLQVWRHPSSTEA